MRGLVSRRSLLIVSMIALLRVATPANAHHTYVKSDMDLLVLGNVLVRKSG